MLALADPALLKSLNYSDGGSRGAGKQDVTNPANGNVIVRTANGGAADAKRAMENESNKV